MAKQLNVNLAFTADTTQAAKQIQNLQTTLNQLTLNASLNNKLGLNKELTEATNQVTKLKSILSTSTDKDTGLLNFKTFNAEIKKSGINVEQYAKSLNKLGPDGAKAFSQLSAAVSTANLSFNKANGLMSELWTTMKNTLRWQLTSSALHSFIGGLEQAYGYAQDLNKSLTDIRIVAPEKSLGDMADFAKVANKQAKELGASTLDYVNGALIYYQQGLNDLETKARTDVTIKMKNVTGDSAEDVSSYMTAIWNNFNKDGEHAEEYYADVLTKLGADTAASTTEITSALEKYSAVADTIGLSYEAATAAATTLIDRTREAPEVAGTALKTVFARLQGLKLNGEVTDEDGVTTDLNKYSTALASVGVQIKDANGELKNADTILEEVGEKWKTLDRDQKTALAQSVAGLRQYNQFAALMDNYDYYKKYKEIAETGSAGTLQKQQEIYAQSWEGASKRVKAAMEGIYQAVLDDSFFITLTNGFADILNVIGQLAEGLGGLKTILPLIGALLLKTFSSQISNSIGNISEKIALSTKSGRKAIIEDKQKWNQALINNAKSDGTVTGDTIANVNKQRGELNNKLIKTQTELQASNKSLTESEEAYVQSLMDTNRALGDKQIKESEKIQTYVEQDKDADEQISRLYSTSNNNKPKNYSKSTKKKQRFDQAVQTMQTYSGLSSIGNTINLNKEQTVQKSETNFSGAKEDMLQYENTFRQTAKTIGISCDALEEDFSKLRKASDTKELQKAIDNLIDKFEQLETKAEEASNAASGIAKKGGFHSEALEAQLKNKRDAIEGAGEKAVKHTQTGQNLEENSENINKALDDFEKKGYTGAQAITQTSEAAMSLIGTFMSLTSTVQTLNDEEATFIEKISAIGMSFTMLIPSITSTFDMVKVLKGMDLTSTITALGGDATKATTGIKGLGNALKSLLTVNPLVTMSIVALSAAIAGAILLFKAMYNEAHSARQKFEHLSESADIASEHLSEVQSKASQIDNTLNGLDSKRETLKGLTYGTREWRQAVNELNNDIMTTVKESNKMSNSLTKSQKNKALESVNEKLKDANLEETDTIDLKLNEDYFYDSEGVLQYTASGELKLEAVNTILVDQATINANAAEIAKNNAEIEANREEFLSGDFGQGKQYKHSKEYSEQNTENTRAGRSIIRKADTEGSLSKEGYDAIMNAFQSGTLNAQSDMNKKSGLIEGLDLSESDKDLILSNSALREALYEDAQATMSLKESNEQIAANDINNSEEVNKTIENSKQMTDEDREYYSSGVKQVMGEDVTSLAETYAEDPYKSKLIGKTEKLDDTKYKNRYAEAHGIEKDSKEYDNISEEDIAYMLAYNKALEEVEDNTEDYIKLLKDTKKDEEALKEIQGHWEANKDLINAANKELEKHNGKWSKVSKTTKQEMRKLAKVIKPQLMQALDLKDDELGVLNAKFITKNSKLIEKAINGDVEAVQKLQKAYSKAAIEKAKTKEGAKTLGVEFDKDFSQEEFNGLLDQVNNFINSADFDDIQIGAELDSASAKGAEADLFKIYEQLVTQAGLSCDQINDLFGGAMNVEFDGYDLIPTEESTKQVSASKFSKKHNLEMPVTEIGDGGIGYHIDTKQMDNETFEQSASDWKQKGYILKPRFKGKKTKNIPKNINPPNVNPTGANNARNGGGGGNRNRSRARKEKPRRRFEKSNVTERYKEITDQLDRIKRTSEKLSKVQDELYGKSKLKAMDAVNKKHLEEISLLRTKTEQARKYLLNDKQDVKKRLNEAKEAATSTVKAFSKKYLTSSQISAIKNIGSDFAYNEFGEITNYTKIMNAMQDELNAFERYYNNKKNFNTEETQEKFKENNITPLKEAIDRLQEAIDQYDETRELIEELKTNIEEAYIEWQTQNYEKLTYSLEIKTTVNDNDLSLLEYKINKISDNVYKAAELLSDYFSGALGEDLTGKFGLTTQAVENQLSAFKDLDKAYQNGLISQASYVEGLQDIYTSLLENLGTLEDLKSEMIDYYSNTLSSVIEQLDKYNSRLDTTSSLLSHYQSIIEMTGKGSNYDLLEKMYAANTAVLTGQLNTSKATYELAKNEVDKLKAQRDAAREQMLAVQTPEGLRALKNILDAENTMTDEAFKQLKEKQYEAYDNMLTAAMETAADAEEQLFSSVESALESAASQLETALQRAAKAVEDALTGIVGGFEELTRQMDLTSKKQEEYLTKTNQGYELNKMQRTLSKDIDKTDSKSAKAKLTNFSKELRALQEKDKLSKLELEIAQKKYDLLKAQIALEESQNAKSTVRLTRDNEGNYGYVYVANEEKIEEAAQAVEDANNKLYNTQLEATNDYGQKYLSTVQEYKQALQELYESDEFKELDENQRNERISAIQKQYGDILNSYQDLYKIAYGSTDSLIDAIQSESWVYSNYNDNIKQASDNLSVFDTYVKDANDAINIWTTQITNITDYVKFDDRMENVVSTTEDTVNNILKEFETTGENLTQVLDDVGLKIKDFINTLLPSLTKWSSSVEGTLEYINKLLFNAANGNIDLKTRNFNKFMTLMAGSNADQLQYGDNHVAYGLNGVSKNATSWSADVIASNETIASQLIDLYESGKTGYFGFDSKGIMSYFVGSQSDAGFAAWKKKIVTAPQQFESGGYTGSWDESGRVAILHEKELVLNQDDTKNILTVVQLVRQIAANSYLDTLTPGVINNSQESFNTVQQQVTIDASFPSVSDRNEIEQAFNNLVNRAAQHAFKNKK